VIYPDEAGAKHGTLYDMTVFINGPLPAGPRFRNTYLRGKAGKVTTRFEIAPPGSSEGFSVYIEAIVRRK